MKKTISFILSLLMVFSCVPIAAYADDRLANWDANNVCAITEAQMNENAYKYIENALKDAKNYATAETPYKIIVPSGYYLLEGTLHIYSNTSLELQSDTTLLRGVNGNMIKAGKNGETSYGYEGYKNISISGGIWDGDGDGSCIMRFAHCQNVTIQNCSMQNQYGDHFIEVAAAYNFNILGCKFENYTLVLPAADGLAIQIDHMHSSYHFPNYPSYDDTPCQKVTVENCQFSNVYAGVGTRAGVDGSYFTEMNIRNNTFTNVKNIAIRALNYKNSDISGNNITDATYGIVFENYPETNVSGRLFSPYSGVVNIDNNTQSQITGNTINVINKQSSGNSSGIMIYGGSGHRVEGLNISGNSISSSSASSKGIYLRMAGNSSVNSNTITSLVSSNSNGISVYSGKNIAFDNNNIGSFKYGVSTTGSSKGNVFNKNNISNNRYYAIYIDKSSKATINYGNTFSANKKGKFQINGKKYSVSTKKLKFKAKKDKKNKKNYVLTWKKASSVTGYKIYRSKKKKSGYTLLKTVKGAKKVKYTDKKAKGKKYYYKIQAYKSANGTTIYGKLQ